MPSRKPTDVSKVKGKWVVTRFTESDTVGKTFGPPDGFATQEQADIAKGLYDYCFGNKGQRLIFK